MGRLDEEAVNAVLTIEVVDEGGAGGEAALADEMLVEAVDESMEDVFELILYPC